MRYHFHLLLFASVHVWGCRTPPPTGSPITPPPLGSVVDEANRVQEHNAEQAKFIVYTHEFELNDRNNRIDNPWYEDEASPSDAIRQKRHPAAGTVPGGFRLNEYGREHIQQIAKSLSQDTSEMQWVIVERSESSKHWGTRHQYPVHWNRQLDAARRAVVVNALVALGVDMAKELVHIAPAFPEGLYSIEAVNAYQRTLGTNQNNNTNGSFGGAF